MGDMITGANFVLRGEIVDIDDAIPDQPHHPCTVVLINAADEITPVIVPASVLADNLPLLCASRPTELGGRLEKHEGRMHHVATYGAARCMAQCSGPQGCEIDHLISLELGGANTSVNLWPQPYDGDWNAHDKDRLENKLHRMICVEKSISLKAAQKEIADDWIAAYKKHIGARRPFKPQIRCHTR